MQAEMTGRAVMRASMKRQPAERIPTMPQICHDVAVRLFANEDGRDWIDAVARCIESPETVYDYVIRLVEKLDCDGLRLFERLDPKKVKRVREQLLVLDPNTNERIGRIDLHGGTSYIPDLPPAPAETLGEVRKALADQVADLTDAKLDALRKARARVPERFVASSPGGITMNTYSQLRGRVQALYDFYDRPDFVAAVMDMQSEAIIQRAEKLLTTGIDAFYIGDPSSSGSLLSPQHFEKYCLPGYQKFCNHFRERDILIYIHICGNSNGILEMMAETGADCVEPLDPLGGVSVADAKARIGSRVALMGGVNTLTLSRGTAGEVHSEAIRKCREGGPTGYILAAGDMVPPDTSMENLQTLVNVARKSLWRTGA